MNIAKSNQLARYIHEKCVPPKEVDKFADKVEQEALNKWLKFQAANTNIQLAITINYKQIPLQVYQGKKSVLEI